MKSNHKAIRILDWITNIMAFLAGAVIVFVTFLIAASVISRSVGGDGIPWTLEITEYSLVYACFLAVPWVLRQDAHVRVDFVLERIAKKSQKASLVVQRTTDVLMAVICGLMAYYGFKMAIDLWGRHVLITSILNWPKAPIILIIPIGFLVMLAQLIRVSVDREHSRRIGVGKPSGEEVAK